MKWALLILLMNGQDGGVQVTQVDFESEHLCRSAQEKVKPIISPNLYGHGRRLIVTCLQVRQ